MIKASLNFERCRQMIDKENISEASAESLIAAATKVASNAYAPYSAFRVGAALLSSAGKVYVGANVENASYPCGICAERAAVAAAVSQGERSFSAIALVALDGEGRAKGVLPCGMCRQVLSEFASREAFDVFTLFDGGTVKRYTLDELLPHSFSITEKEDLS